MIDATDHTRAPLPFRTLAWAISSTLAVFMAWGWLTRADIAGADSVQGFLQDTGAGYLALAALGLILQLFAGYGAQAIRRARTLGVETSRRFAIGAVVVGSAFTALALHNAIEQAGMIEAGDWFLDALMWAMSAGVAYVEFSAWWLDEELRSAAETMKAADDAAALAAAQSRDRARSSPIGVDVAAIDERALSDEALAAASTMAFSLGKRLSDEQRRRNGAKRHQSVSG